MSRQHRILILEDEADIVDLIRQALEGQDLDIATANTADGMSRIISSNFFDTIILDNAMPFMTGIELVRTVRAQRVTTPVIFVSGGLTALEQEETKRLGAIEFFSKPFERTLLANAVRRYVALGSRLTVLEIALADLQQMGALSSSSCESFKHLLLTLLKVPAQTEIADPPQELMSKR